MKTGKSYTSNFELAKRLAQRLYEHSHIYSDYDRAYNSAKRAATYYGMSPKQEEEIQKSLGR